MHVFGSKKEHSSSSSTVDVQSWSAQPGSDFHPEAAVCSRHRLFGNRPLPSVHLCEECRTRFGYVPSVLVLVPVALKAHVIYSSFVMQLGKHFLTLKMVLQCFHNCINGKLLLYLVYID